MWYKDRIEDIKASEESIRQRKAYKNAPWWKKIFIPDNFEEEIKEVTPDLIEKAFQGRKNDLNHPSRHKWNLFNNCKHEADRLVEDAKKLTKNSCN